MSVKQPPPDLDLLAQLAGQGRQFMSSTETAQVLGYTEEGLGRLRSRGGGPPFVPIHDGNNAPKLYPLKKFMAWLESRTVGSTAERSRLAAEQG